MAEPMDIGPRANSTSFPLDPARDAVCKTITITDSSQTLAELLGEALPEGAIQAWIDFSVNDSGKIYYNPKGPATNANGMLFTPTDIVGPEVLQVCELLGSSSVIATLIIQTALWRV